MAVFTGVGVALLTLFDEHDRVDVPATVDLAVDLVARGMQGVVVAGSTGEAAALDPDERVALVAAVRAAVPPGVPVVAGTGAVSAHHAVAYTSAAVDAGADAVLALSPPGSSDLDTYYASVADAASERPVLAYHYPSVSAPGIPVDVLPKLPVTGCKDSSGDAGRMLEELASFTGDLYTGSSALLSFAGPIGCTGAILSLANAEPERCIAAFGGDADVQLGLAGAHLRAHERFPRALKEMVAEQRGTSTACRIA
jgi:4-hydroxy-tetrahydrodipicolinate synthase